MDTSGTIAYMAPELFTKSPSAVMATDIWALGATLYELITGELLFFGQGGVVQLKGAELPELPDSYSQDLRETVASCLSMDTWSRPTASELTGYAESMLKGEKVRKPWKDRKGADSKEKSDSRKTERRAGSTSGEAEPHPNQPNSRSSKKKWIWPTLFLLLIIGGSFAGYELNLNKSSSAEISQQRQKDSLSKVEREQRAATETAVRATTGMLNGHEWVDLGLSVLWATCNVGASSPSDYGNYYAWGETKTKSSYTEDNSRTYKVEMGDISGNPSYDAATANWGGGWRMPTNGDLEELVDMCDWVWTSQGGRSGYKVTGPTGNSIFLPDAGLRYGTSFNRLGSYYWSSTPDGGNTQYACSLYIFNDLYGVDWYSRGYGRSVRPVLDKEDVLIEERRLKLDSIKKDVSRGIKDSAPTFGLG